MVAPAQMGYVDGIHDRHPVHISMEVVRYPDHIEQALERPHHSSLAIAAQSAQHHTAPPAGSQACGKAFDLRFNGIRAEECASETADFSLYGTTE